MHKTSHFDALTGLRFFAAAAIVVHHLGRGNFFQGDLIPALCMGAAVPLFFALSGFVLTLNSSKYKSWTDFYVARFARIYPSHLATVGLLWLAFYPYSHALFEPPYQRAALLNLSLTQAWSPNILDYFSLNSPSWSVSCEIFFYAAFPLLVFWMRSRPMLKAVGLYAFVIAALWAVSTVPMSGTTRTWFGYINPVTNLPAFCFGIAFGRLSLESETGGRSSFVQCAALIGAVCANALAVRLFNEKGTALSQFASVSAVTPVYALLLFALTRYTGAVTNFLALRPIAYLGEASYALYLVHQVVFRWWIDKIQIRAFEISRPVAALCAVVSTVVIAIAIHHVVERPARRAIINAWRRMRDLRLGRLSMVPDLSSDGVGVASMEAVS